MHIKILLIAVNFEVEIGIHDSFTESDANDRNLWQDRFAFLISHIATS